MTGLKKIALISLFAFLALGLASAQSLTSTARAAAGVAPDEASSPAVHSFPGMSVRSNIDFLNDFSDDSDIPPSFTLVPGNLDGIVSVPNFSGTFTRAKAVWPFTMIGKDPARGGFTRIPAKIIAVSLELQNADLVTTTVVPVAPFEQLVLNSPNFRKARYEHEDGKAQFADAVQRAEFFSAMKDNWHTELTPAAIVERVTIHVPRFVNARVGGVVRPVRTYFTGTASDGNTFVLLLSPFFNQQFANTVVNGINNNAFTTGSMNIVLLPNTFLFNLSRTGGLGGCCVLGFHTFFFDGTANPTPVWVTAFASWISPGLFGGGAADVTGMSHEISEAFNDPFLNNGTPRWQFPGIPGACQGNLESGDPVEVLANSVFPVTIKGTDDDDEAPVPAFTYHPQTEALLQWFNGASPSDAIHGAYSYPDLTALTAPATLCP